jgi:hypothetical protein
MKNKNRIVSIWILGNIFLLVRFLIDPFLILCEPCISGYPCPPCRTEFAKDIWIYFLIWNVLVGIVFIIKKKKTYANNVQN